MRPIWACETCGAQCRFKYTPGIITRVPTSMPEDGCPKMLAGVARCGGPVTPANDAARDVEAAVATTAKELYTFMHHMDDEEEALA